MKIRSIARTAGRLGRNWLPYARVGYRAGRLLARGARAYTNRGKALTHNGGGVTDHTDRTTVYARRRMPRRKRKAWVRFVHKVQAVETKSLGSRSLLFNDSASEHTDANQQKVNGVVLYGFAGSQKMGNADMAYLNNNIATGVAAQKVQFKSAVLDITWTNSGTDTIELDVYQYYVTRDIQYSWIYPLFQDAANDARDINISGAPAYGIQAVGASPFDFSTALAKIKIVRKKKYYIGPGHSATYQMRDARNKYFSTDMLDDIGNVDSGWYGRRGWTKGIFWVQKGVPTVVDDATVGAAATNLTWGVTRIYHFVQNESSVNESGLVNYT